MDYSNENYVRVYTRKTADQAVLCWQARALWPQLIMVADRAGIIATKHGTRGLAALTDMPREMVDVGLPELLADGCIREQGGGRGYVLPNYLAAQEAKTSDRQRKREERDRRLALAMASECGVDVSQPEAEASMSRNVTIESQNVTDFPETGPSGHTRSHEVTAGHARSQNVTLSSALLCSALSDHTHKGEAVGPIPKTGDRLMRLTEYALRARWAAETKLHRELKLTTPSPANVATAGVEADARKAVQNWMLEAPDGAEAAETVDARLVHLIAVRTAVSRQMGDLKFWAPSTFWNPDGIAKDLRQTPDQAVAHLTRGRGTRPGERSATASAEANKLGADGYKRGMPPILNRGGS